MERIVDVEKVLMKAIHGARMNVLLIIWPN